LKRPTYLDGSHAGDYGFDPLGLTEPGTGYDLYTMQESELRHARLAMLAVVGWPLSELVAPDWMLQENGCAPSVLNGFNPATFIATALFFAAAGFFEYKTALRNVDSTRLGKIHEQDMELVWNLGVAGDYNFDPMDLYRPSETLLWPARDCER
jgi:Chlorophyll A-B binding protein